MVAISFSSSFAITKKARSIDVAIVERVITVWEAIRKSIYEDEMEVRVFVVITHYCPFPFIICLFFLEGEKKRERESNGDKKMHGVPFHLELLSKTDTKISKIIKSDIFCYCKVRTITRSNNSEKPNIKN